MVRVLVTGCSSGIGLAAAAAFGRRGDRVLAGVRRPESVDAVAERCAGLDVEPVLLDVTEQSSVDGVVAAAVDGGGIDVLVNNAGIGAIGSFEETPEDVYRAVFETNVFGVIAMMRAVLPPMRAAGGGTIVNVGSIVGRVAPPFQPFYAATKHAIEAITDSVHFETSRFGIRVCVVEPGRIPTEFGSNLVSERAPDGSPLPSARPGVRSRLGRHPRPRPTRHPRRRCRGDPGRHRSRVASPPPRRRRLAPPHRAARIARPRGVRDLLPPDH